MNVTIRIADLCDLGGTDITLLVIIVIFVIA
jgi:hypothetical protein